MRRVIVILLALAILPQLHANAEEDPFNIYVENDAIIHPGETVSFQFESSKQVAVKVNVVVSQDASESAVIFILRSSCNPDATLFADNGSPSIDKF